MIGLHLEYSELIAEKIPNSKLVIFEKSSHSVMKDEYDKFLEVVSQFLLSILQDRMKL